MKELWHNLAYYFISFRPPFPLGFVSFLLHQGGSWTFWGSANSRSRFRSKFGLRPANQKWNWQFFPRTTQRLFPTSLRSGRLSRPRGGKKTVGERVSLDGVVVDIVFILQPGPDGDVRGRQVGSRDAVGERVGAFSSARSFGQVGTFSGKRIQSRAHQHSQLHLVRWIEWRHGLRKRKEVDLRADWRNRNIWCMDELTVVRVMAGCFRCRCRIVTKQTNGLRFPCWRLSYCFYLFADVFIWVFHLICQLEKSAPLHESWSSSIVHMENVTSLTWSIQSP